MAAAAPPSPTKPASPTSPASPAKPKRVRRKEKSSTVDLTETQRAEMRQAFDLFDAEGTGRIPASEIKVALRALGFEVKKDELKTLLNEVGTSPTGMMDFNEFLRVIMHKVVEKESKEEVMRAFKMFDETDKGYISLQDLEQIAEILEQDMTEDELREMIEFAHPRTGRKEGVPGRDADSISEEDFMRLMRRANVY